MKLIYAFGTSSLAVHILLEELGVAYEREAVSLRDKTKLESYSPKRCVPLLILDDGEVMAETSCILQYLAEKEQRLDLIGGAPGSIEKFRCIEWLNFISTEFHKGAEPLFKKNLQGTFKNELINSIENRLEFIDEFLSARSFLTGKNITIADIYLLVNLHIIEYLKFDLNKFLNIMRYMKRLDEIPSVKRAAQQEKEEDFTEEEPASMELS